MASSGLKPARLKESSPHVRKKRRRRRDEILGSALRTFREKGFYGTTLEEIASNLGLRKTALYYYFPDKEAILFECHRISLDELARVMEETYARFETASDRLSHVIREHVRVMTEVLEGSPLALEVTALSPERQAEVVQERDRYERRLREIIAQGVADGEFRSVDPKIASFAVLGAINWIARWYDPEGAMGSPELGAEFVEHLIGGLLGQAHLYEDEPPTQTGE
jgi:TetR/AcrR family transcriptional regulator